jgi:bile acid:Na+ symporter, BASS family
MCSTRRTGAQWLRERDGAVPDMRFRVLPDRARPARSRNGRTATLASCSLRRLRVARSLHRATDVSPTELIPLAVANSLRLILLGVGLRAAPQSALQVLRRPAHLGRTVLAMFVIMPGIAVAGALALDLHPAIKIALVALSVSPVPPILPNSALKTGVTLEDTIGLLVAASLLSMALVPLAMALIGPMFGLALAAPLTIIFKQMVLGVLAPLAAGMTLRQLVPGVADQLAKPVSVAGEALLLVCVAVILFGARHSMGALLGHGTLAVFVIFVCVGLAVGHWLGGPDPSRRSVLALATASRHPGVAIAIVRTNFPEQKLALAAVLLYLLVSLVVSLPYSKWRKAQSVLVVQH